MIDSFVTIVPAAGSGDRFSDDVPKQFLTIGDKSILDLSIEPLLDFSECLGICIVVAPDDQYHKSLKICENPKISIIEGGITRMSSVTNGVLFWKDSGLSFKNILVHDSVRPCLRSSEVRVLLESMSVTDIDGVILGSSCSDTVKEINKKDLSIRRTLDRERLWTAFTPQIFKKEVLFNATIENTHDDKIFTDEASLVEVNGGKLKMIQGSKDNLKITLPEDINLAKSILISHGRLETLL